MLIIFSIRLNKLTLTLENPEGGSVYVIVVDPLPLIVPDGGFGLYVTVCPYLLTVIEGACHEFVPVNPVNVMLEPALAVFFCPFTITLHVT